MTPYTPQQNEVAKKKNKTLKEMVNSMLSYSGLKLRDAIFDKEWFTSIPRPRGMIQPSLSKIAEDEVKCTDDVPEPFVLRKIIRIRKAKSFGISTIRLLLALAAIQDLVIHQMDVKTAFLNGDLDEEIYMKQPEGFVMPGHKSRCFNNMEDHSSTSGWVFFLGGGAISWALKKHNCITSSTMESKFVALAAAGNEAEWLRNLVYEIPFWPKPISTISIRCDSAATLAKAYNQVYNGKSRHLGVRHSMICELIMNGVISMEFVRIQLNLADHLTKGLVRDLVRKAVIGMGLKST
nr:zinc finger, CCHC-type [Tanacetum cinerariifolium]